MHKDKAIIMVIIYLIICYLLEKYYKLAKKKKNMNEINCTCTDIIIRRNYKKKYYMYFYKLKYQKNEEIITDKLRLPIFQNFIKINNKYLMMINPKNPNEYLTPIEYKTYKYYLYVSIFLFILSLLFFF